MGNQTDEFNALDQRLSQPRSAKPNRERSLGTLSAPTGLMRDSEEIRIANRRVEELVKQAGAPRLLKLSQLRQSPYQTKSVTKDSVSELVENLRQNPLTTPIVVREIAPGVFEVIAGHGRTLSYEILGREEIPGVVVQMSDEEAEGAVFYDNFYPPNICDFEKFLGLQQIKNRRALTHEQLADRSGISRQLVGYLMAFERLPDGALERLRSTPTTIGAATAMKLAQLDASFAPRIVEGLRLIEAGELKQSQLVDWVTEKAKLKTVAPSIVKVGRQLYAKLSRREKRLTIDFTNIEDAAVLEKEILAFIKAQAAKP